MRAMNIKNVVADAQKEIRRRQRISKKQKGTKKKRKTKNKGKKRKKKVVTTTQTAQPPIRLSNTKGDKLEVNIVAKERRKKKPKTFAERRAEEIAKTGIADPAIIREQQRITSDVLGYRTQSRDPITLRNRRGRYNQQPADVRGYSSVNPDPQLGTLETGGYTGLVAGYRVGQQVSGARQLGRGGAWYRTEELREKRYSDTGTQTDKPPKPKPPKLKRTKETGTDPIPQLPIGSDIDSISLRGDNVGRPPRGRPPPRPPPRQSPRDRPPPTTSSSGPSSRGGGAGAIARRPTREDDSFSLRSLIPPPKGQSGRGILGDIPEGQESYYFFSDADMRTTTQSTSEERSFNIPQEYIVQDSSSDDFVFPSQAEIDEENFFQQYDAMNRYLNDQKNAPTNSSTERASSYRTSEDEFLNNRSVSGSGSNSYRTSEDEFLMNKSISSGDDEFATKFQSESSFAIVPPNVPSAPQPEPEPSIAGQVAGAVASGLAGAVSGAVGTAGDLASGVAQGVVSQLPSTQDVGKAVGGAVAQGVGAVGKGAFDLARRGLGEIISRPLPTGREINRALPRSGNYMTADQLRRQGGGRPQSVDIDTESLVSELSSIQDENSKIKYKIGRERSGESLFMGGRNVPRIRRDLLQSVNKPEDIQGAIDTFDREYGREHPARTDFLQYIRNRARQKRIENLIKLSRRRKK